MAGACKKAQGAALGQAAPAPRRGSAAALKKTEFKRPDKSPA